MMQETGRERLGVTDNTRGGRTTRMGTIDFSLSTNNLSALLAALGFPVCLAIVARLPGLVGRNALQFLVTWIMMAVAWSTMAMGSGPWGVEDLIVSAMILGSATILYLEAWALLSRGYTLGLLVTLLRARRPVDEKALAEKYRGGRGLSWILRHRLGGLETAGLVRTERGWVMLTPAFGVSVGRLYGASVRVLGLRRVG